MPKNPTNAGSALDAVKAVTREVASLPNQNTPNYKMSAIASAETFSLAALLWWECHPVASFMTAVAASYYAFAGINQYGGPAKVYNDTLGFFNKLPKSENAAQAAKEVAEPAASPALAM